jgi:hypothetical protein
LGALRQFGRRLRKIAENLSDRAHPILRIATRTADRATLATKYRRDVFFLS